MKILTIVGARPQFIKAAIFSKEIQKHKDIEEIIIHTGQHYDPNMSQIFFDELKIPKPKYNLKINGGSHAEQTGQMLIKLEKIILEEKPTYVLVYGDTNSTLAGALAGSKIHVKIIHVEAGFRSHDKNMPEEINRIITDHISDILFCPTKSAVEELKKEGVVKGVHFVGDITYDAANYFVNKGEEKKIDEKYYFCTIHRAVNTDSEKNLREIFEGLISLNEKIILPIHPRTKNKLKEFNIWEKYQNKNIEFIEPINYLDSLKLIKNAEKIITDSGGVLREAYYFKKTCIVLRENIEFIEAIENGEAVLVGASRDKINKAVESFKAKGEFKSFFGDGNACEKIIEVIKSER